MRVMLTADGRNRQRLAGEVVGARLHAVTCRAAGASGCRRRENMVSRGGWCREQEQRFLSPQRILKIQASLKNS